MAKVISLTDYKKGDKQQPATEGQLMPGTFADIMEANKAKQARLVEERKAANAKTLRSFRIKP